MPFIKNVAIFARKGVIDVVVSPFCQIDGGGGTQENFSVAIDKNGRAWAWGINNSGQLGNNSITPSSSPVSVLGNVKTFCKIAAAGGGGSQARHTIAIDKNGRLWSWGFNGVGQLGNNSITSQRTPVSVCGSTKTFCKINIGADHSLGITRTGRLWAWGGNFYGQLGDNTTISRLTPVSVAGGVKTFCEIIAGGNFYSFAIDKNGRLWAWGLNTFGNLGDNSTASRITPVSVCGSTKTFCKIDAGYAHSLAIEKNGRVWAWGRNDFGQLGNAGFVSQRTPVSIAGAVKTFCEISGGGNHSLAIDKNGRLWAWGNNAFGQLGNNSLSSIRSPVSVLGAVKTFCKIAAGDDHSIAIDKNGRMWAWGRNFNGELGDKNTTNKCTPISVVGTTKTFCKIAAERSHALAIDKNGRVWAWGNNGSGQLGDNTTTERCTPISILGAVKTFCQISNGSSHTLAIDKNGRAWAWGGNSNGELGDGTAFINKCTPVSIAGAVKTFCQIDGAINHSLAIDKNGRVWAWGNNGAGQLGDNSTTSRLTPVSVCGSTKTFCKISAGSTYTLAIEKNGRVWSWGVNTFGTLGDNSTISKLTPVSILGAVKTFCHISAGNLHSLAIDKNGRVWAWGNNGSGQLGDNTTTQRLTPVSILGAAKVFVKISAGDTHSVAIDNGGRVWAWGAGSSGQIGDGGATLLNRRTPVSVAGAIKTFCEISAGVEYTLAIEKNGRVWAWGRNDYFQLGNNYATRTPVRVCFL